MKNRIKELREKRELTQEQLAKQIGLSKHDINAIETGRVDPTLWVAYDLSEYFGVIIEDLFLFNESIRN